jgi:hypothetical protein
VWQLNDLNVGDEAGILKDIEDDPAYKKGRRVY